MADFEEQLNLLLQEAADIYSPLGIEMTTQLLNG